MGAPARALMVFAKWPESGKVKTRLCPPFSLEEAAQLYMCFLKDALRQYDALLKDLGCKLFLYGSPRERLGDFDRLTGEELVSRQYAVVAQTDGDLGERMYNAFREVFSQGFREVIVIGTDHPTLPDEFIREAFRQLDRTDREAVVGPSEDGGYYLLGLHKLVEDIFKDIPWSTGSVLDKTLQKLQSAGIRFAKLETWYDVDDYDSYTRMTAQLDSGLVAPAHTTKFVTEKAAL